MSSHAADLTGTFSKSEALCKYFLKSSCAKGDKCVFSHDMSVLKSCPENRVCHFYLRGTCTKGQNCYFLHEQPELNVNTLQGYENIKVNYKKNRKNMSDTHICKYCLSGDCFGDNCQFRHSNVIPICVYHLRGVCRYGALCRNDHINITTEQSCNIPDSSDKDANPENFSASSQIDKEQVIISDTSNNSAQEPGCEGSAVGLLNQLKTKLSKLNRRSFKLTKSRRK